MATEIDNLSDEAKRALLAQLLRQKAGQAETISPLSYGQRAWWFLYQLEPQNPSYNIMIPARILSELDAAALGRAFAGLIRRHAVLRATFSVEDGCPVQKVTANVDAPLNVVDASGWDEDRLKRALSEEAHRPFDLERGPVVRAHLFTRSAREHVLLMTVHHIAFDLWSLVTFMHELGGLYAAEKGRRSAALPALKYQYADYVRWQEQLLAGAQGERLWGYWQRQLAGELPAVNLPTFRPRPPVQTSCGAAVRFTLDEETTRRLKELSAGAGATLYMTLLAAWQALLHRYSGQGDILVGSLAAGGRNRAEFAGLVGFFDNQIVLRADLSPNPTFAEFLRETRQTVLDALEHQQYPFPLLVERLQPARDASRAPIFQTMFILQRAQRPEEADMLGFGLGVTGARVELGELTLEAVEFERRVAGGLAGQLDMTLVVAELGGRLEGSLQYNPDVFDKELAAQMARHYGTLIASALRDPEARVAALPLLDAADWHRQVVEWNDTAADVPRDCLHQPFERRAADAPEATAAACAGRRLSYGELNARANQLAHHLRERGVGPGARVGICFERSPEMLVAVLGVLKAGGAYVPLDPAYPKDRLAFMLEDVQAPVLLTQQKLVALLPEHGGATVCLDSGWDEIAARPAHDPRPNTTGRDLAYIIYTSGSTGRPKGVMIDHRGAANTIADMNARYAVGAGDRVLALSSLSFDLSVYDMLGTLAAGATIVVPDPSPAPDPSHWLELIEREQVTVWNSAPALMEMFIRYVSDNDLTLPDALRLVLMSGDWIPVTLPDQIRARARRAEVHSLGGATEASIWSNTYPIGEVNPHWRSIPYGRPMVNQRFHVLDASLSPVPVGVVGELYIGGVGVALGYHRRPALTAERFIPDPFSAEPSMRLYRTGDLGRYLPDGNIEFLGRIDGQVKVRGFRVELGEIEAALTQHPAVRENVVVTRPTPSGEKQLVAYVVPRQEAEADAPAAFDEQHWQALSDAAGRQAELPTVTLPDAAYPALTGGLTRLAVVYLGEALTKLGLFTRAGESHTAGEIIERCGVIPRYTKTIGRWLEFLAGAGRLARSGETFNSPGPLTTEPAAPLWAEVKAQLAGTQVTESFGYFQACGENLAEVLTGRVHPAQLLFREGESQVAESFYEEGFRYCNAIAREVVRSLARRPPRGRALRVLEIGAGVGSTTAWLLPELPPAETEYHYTDVSRYFLEVGKKNFGHHPFMSYDLLDIERDPEAQGYEPCSFDLVVASSVLHATRDVRETLRHARSLLAPRGLLLLVEETRFFDWFNVVGIQEGFDRFEDTGLRPSHPFLSAEQWRAELQAQGFDRAASFGRDRFTAELLGIDVVVAQASSAVAATARIDKESLRVFLRERLPEFMIPAAFVTLGALPLTPNGKVARNALPAPDPTQSDDGRVRVAPRTPAEEVLAGLWAQLLNVERVGVEDNFFELGGDSLLATQLVTRLRNVFEVELPLRCVFESPTVAGLAEQVERHARDGRSAPAEPLARAPRDQSLPLSFAQQRLWLLDQLFPGHAFYNATTAVRLRGDLDRGALEQSIAEIVRRHESLRTAFVKVDGQPVQVIAEEASVPTTFVDLAGLDAEERDACLNRLATEEARRPFDLASVPLMRVTLVRLDDEEHALLLAFHHIVYDGWSFGVVMRELSALYEAFIKGAPSPLAELPVQYADYAVWQRRRLTGERLAEHLDYWEKQLAGSAVLELPTDRPRPEAQTLAGARQTFFLPAEMVAALKALSRGRDVTFFMTLLAALQLQLSRYTGAEDVVVGSPVANRTHAEVDGLIGFFLNALPMRTDLSGDPPFVELLGRVRKTALDAYAHQDLPFEKLVEELRPERKATHTPLFRVWFALQNAPMPSMRLPGLELSMMHVDDQTSKFDLVLTMFETERGMATTWIYNTDLFDDTTVARFARHFERLLAGIAANPDARLSELDMLTDEERRRQAAEAARRQESNLQRLMGSRRRAVNLGQVNPIKAEHLGPGESLPLVIRPAVDGVDLVGWARGARDYIQSELLRHGALLFRGFTPHSLAAFGEFARAVCTQLFIDYGDLPRADLGQKVYTSTPYPADRMILYHHESSHMHRWPMKIMFYCDTPARGGGETPVVDCRKMHSLLPESLRRRFEERQLLYVRNYREELDVSWQEFFRTTERAEVERRCRESGEEFEWLKGGSLRTRKVRPAVLKHPSTGEAVFFNQMLAHHVSCLEPEIRQSLLALFGEEGLPRNVYYGDGEPIEDSVVAEIVELYRQVATVFPWQEGDILLADNMLAGHARNPFVGPRKIMVAMGEMASLADFGA
ncbi:MAG: amino acid adenylation domain-containing protein [Pyrinomonadaceae bacterium]